MDILKLVDEMNKCRKEGLKESSRYDIDILSNGGTIKLFFANKKALSNFEKGKYSIASTERFSLNDIMWTVNSNYVSFLSDSRTLAHLNYGISLGDKIKYLGENGDSTLNNLTVGEAYRVVNIEKDAWFEYVVDGEIFTAYIDEWDEWDVKIIK